MRPAARRPPASHSMRRAAGCLTCAPACAPHAHPCKPPQARWSLLAHWHGLRLASLTLVSLSATAADAACLGAMLAAGSGATLTCLVLVRRGLCTGVLVRHAAGRSSACSVEGLVGAPARISCRCFAAAQP